MLHKFLIHMYIMTSTKRLWITRSSSRCNCICFPLCQRQVEGSFSFVPNSSILCFLVILSSCEYNYDKWNKVFSVFAQRRLSITWKKTQTLLWLSRGNLTQLYIKDEEVWNDHLGVGQQTSSTKKYGNCWALLLVHNYLRFLTVEKMQSAIGSKPYSRV